MKARAEIACPRGVPRARLMGIRSPTRENTRNAPNPLPRVCSRAGTFPPRRQNTEGPHQKLPPTLWGKIRSGSPLRHKNSRGRCDGAMVGAHSSSARQGSPRTAPGGAVPLIGLTIELQVPQGLDNWGVGP